MRQTRTLLALLSSLLWPMAGCDEDDTPHSFLPPLPAEPTGDGAVEPATDAGASDASASEAGTTRSTGASLRSDWCKGSLVVRYRDDEAPQGTFSFKGTLSRSAAAKSTTGQVVIAVLEQDPVLAFITGMPLNTPVVQFVARECDWSTDSQTLNFEIQGIPRAPGAQDYYLGTFFDISADDDPRAVQSGDLTGADGVSARRLPANPQQDEVLMDVVLNFPVP